MMQIERAKGAAIKITDALELIQFEWMVWVFTFIYYNMDGEGGGTAKKCVFSLGSISGFSATPGKLV